MTEHEQLLCASFERLLGRPLLAPDPAGADGAVSLMGAPFVLLSHTTDDDPVFNYANRAAMRLFELKAEDILGMPSRFSAEPVHRDERARLLHEVTTNGFIADYAGIRITATGRRFRVEGAVVWNLIDETGEIKGQAATFDVPSGVDWI